MADYRKLIEEKCDFLKKTLLEKNEKYGNSAFEPIRVFAKDTTNLEQIKVRMDDKLSRIINEAKDNEDTYLDLAGYLILYMIARDVKNK